MQRLYILALGFVVTLGGALGILMYVSLIPFIHYVGIAVLGLLGLGAGCVSLLMAAYTYSQVGVMLARRKQARYCERVIVAGDVVAYLTDQGQLMHLSAEHERAKLLPDQTMVVGAAAAQDDAALKKDVVQLYLSGNSLREIAAMLGISYYKAQKWAKEADIARYGAIEG